MNCQVLPHNKALNDGCSQSQQNFDVMAVPQPVPNSDSPARSYEVWLNNFSSDICGNLAYYWIKLFDQGLDYSDVRPVWWLQDIPWKYPRVMLKKCMLIVAGWIFKANEAKTKLHFSAICYVESCLNIAREST